MVLSSRDGFPYPELQEHIERLDQTHVLKWWHDLSEDSRSRLLHQLKGIDWSFLEDMMALSSGGEPKATDSDTIEPVKAIVIPETSEEKRRVQEARERGEAFISHGKVAAFLVAGGQGTRLGFDGPKGAFPIGPVTGKSLFALHAEKIRAESNYYGVNIPWYIMTSETNDRNTRQFFAENGYFGFAKDDIFFFSQRMLPALDRHGKIILDAKDHIFMSPNGHGGSLLALKESGALDHMKQRGIELISYFQVDNVLIKIIDPVFIGYHRQRSAEMSSKMVAKRDPDERVGVFGRIDGKLKVIEYSELPDNLKNRRTAEGELVFGGGSIAIHLINVDFVNSIAGEEFKLPFYRAIKKIPYIDSHGRAVQPEQPNGFKFESFVFDALTLTSRSVIMEVIREDEFSPVKNSSGADSPETARKALSTVAAGWLEAAGYSVKRDEHGQSVPNLEISPLYARNQESLLARSEGIEVRDGLYLGP